MADPSRTASVGDGLDGLKRVGLPASAHQRPMLGIRNGRQPQLDNTVHRPRARPADRPTRSDAPSPHSPGRSGCCGRTAPTRQPPSTPALSQARGAVRRAVAWRSHRGSPNRGFSSRSLCTCAVVGNGAIMEAPATGVERACDRVCRPAFARDAAGGARHPRRGPARACVRPRRPAPSPRGPRSRAGSYLWPVREPRRTGGRCPATAAPGRAPVPGGRAPLRGAASYEAER